MTSSKTWHASLLMLSVEHAWVNQNIEWTWLVGESCVARVYRTFLLIGSCGYFLPVSTGLNVYAPMDMYHGFKCRNACGMARTYMHSRKKEFRLSLTKASTPTCLRAKAQAPNARADFKLGQDFAPCCCTSMSWVRIYTLIVFLCTSQPPFLVKTPARR